MTSLYVRSTALNIEDNWPPLQPSVANALSRVPSSAQLMDLEGNDPNHFHRVVSDAVTNLRMAAARISDPLACGYLWNLANRFQLTLDAGPPEETRGGRVGNLNSNRFADGFENTARTSVNAPRSF